jgi:transposase
MTRMVHHLETREYVAKRTQEGRSYHEIRRSLKRYIARTLYRQLNTLYASMDPARPRVAGAEPSQLVGARGDSAPRLGLIAAPAS